MIPHRTYSYATVQVIAVLVVCGALTLVAGQRSLAGEEPARASDARGRAVPAHETSLPGKSAPVGAASKSPKQADKADANEPTVGDPLAAGKIELLRDEIVTALRSRGVADNFGRFQSYARAKLNSTAGPHTGSELTGNCRLSCMITCCVIRWMPRPRPRSSPVRCIRPCTMIRGGWLNCCR